MLKSTSLFSHVLSLFSRTEFEKHARELKSDRASKGFSNRGQYVAMRPGQVAQRNLLRVDESFR